MMVRENLEYGQEQRAYGKPPGLEVHVTENLLYLTLNGKVAETLRRFKVFWERNYKNPLVGSWIGPSVFPSGRERMTGKPEGGCIFAIRTDKHACGH